MIFGRKKKGALPFKDVRETDYCYEAVLWALENGITTGADKDRFEPQNGCTRGEAITFLWRAEGCPEVKGEKREFLDVKEGDYCYLPIMWALESGISTPFGERIFAANASCTRGQFLNWLHRLQGSPAPKNRVSQFFDVKETDYYFEAVLWAVEQGITSGMGEGAFGPDAICNRNQVIIFLHRHYGKK